MANEMTNSNTALQPTAKGIVERVSLSVKELQQKKSLKFPENYCPENALKAAGLILQETKDRNKNLVLNSCTQASIANSLLNMVIQGLNPIKKQCYFVAYGSNLTLMRSYLGAMHVAKMVDPEIAYFGHEVVYEGDEFTFEKVKGRTIVTKHSQKLQNIDKSKIIAAYCSVFYKDNTENTTIMTLDQIKQAWMQGQIKPVDNKGQINQDSTHGKFTADMAMKTVINKACKFIINQSSDESLIKQSFQNTEVSISEAVAEAEISENANQEAIDIEQEDIPQITDNNVDMETGEIINTTSGHIDSTPERDTTPADVPGFMS